MKFFVSILIIALLAFACGLYLPWWSVALAAFIVAAAIYQPPGRSFLAGFVAILLLWLGLILKINSMNDNILVNRVAQVMGINSSLVLILISSVIGAIVGGMGALTGSFFRKTIQ